MRSRDGEAAPFAPRGVRARRNQMSSRRPIKTRKPVLTLHAWEAKHYVLAAVIILLAVGAFAYSWS